MCEEKWLCNSFDVQYKRIQSFRNQYLTMIRLIMKNKSHLSINDIMKYNEIESKISDLTSEISKLNKSVIKNSKDKKIIDEILSKNNTNNQNQIQVNTEPNIDDIRMVQTLIAFLPFMILYYNSIDNNNQQQYFQTGINQNQNQNQHINDDYFLNSLNDPIQVSLSLD